MKENVTSLKFCEELTVQVTFDAIRRSDVPPGYENRHYF